MTIRKIQRKKVTLLLIITVMISVLISCSNNIILNQDKYNSLVLVNKKNKIDKDFIPKELKVPYVRFINMVDPNVMNMQVDAANALEELFNGAEMDGIILLAVSGYRDYNYQENLYNNEVRLNGKSYADKYVAKPGKSEHQTGLAMDVLSNEYEVLDEGFENTLGYQWLKENSHNYGYIIRFPKGKEKITEYNYEPWHIRYVGVEAATEISRKGITLEEYLYKN